MKKLINGQSEFYKKLKFKREIYGQSEFCENLKFKRGIYGQFKRDIEDVLRMTTFRKKMTCVVNFFIN